MFEFLQNNWKWLTTISFAAATAWFALNSRVEAIDVKHDAFADAQNELHTTINAKFTLVDSSFKEQDEVDKEILIKLENINTKLDLLLDDKIKTE